MAGGIGGGSVGIGWVAAFCFETLGSGMAVYSPWAASRQA
jgi:hypothetical protein